jgi:phosphatidylserine decarboxylase
MNSILEKLTAAVQYILPHHFLSSLIYRFMRVEIVWIKNFQIRMISKLAGVNWSEASSADISSYRHFNAFFTRTLKPEARVFDQNQNTLLCPCDGRISELGKIENGQIFQAKGQSYSLDTLLAGDPQYEQWLDGHFCTIYLSPRDYHRVHMPLDGELSRMTHVPGRLFSVAPYTVRHVPSLFARNERVISVFETRFGPVAQILVGAMLVSSMETVWEGEITPSKNRSVNTRHYTDRKIELSRGKEMGRFNMGSTVILILPAQSISGFEDIKPAEKVLLGQSIARFKS